MQTQAERLNEGKTKIVFATGEPGVGEFESKNDITAGDGAKHDVIQGKAELANRTTCNVFRLLKASGVPVAFREQSGPKSFRGDLCSMILLEVVARREAHGSYLKRAPHLQKGHVFPQLLVELFLKTTGKKWGEHDLPCDDPYAVLADGMMKLYVPNKPFAGSEPFLVLDDYPPKGREELYKQIDSYTRRTFLVLEKAWQMQGRRLVDFKIEFGLTVDGRLVVADVIDNDSWRVVFEGEYEDKQVYRDGGDLNEVTLKYQRVAELTDRFNLPHRQRLIIWTGSPDDNIEALEKAVKKYAGESIELRRVTCSAHKKTGLAYQEMHRLVQEVPDSVVIAEIGRSNGAGPTLASNLPIPVFSRPATWKEVREDVWSSLHVPSDCPNLTVLDPGNAVLAALQVLSRNNPKLYATLRLRQEERLENLVAI